MYCLTTAPHALLRCFYSSELRSEVAKTGPEAATVVELDASADFSLGAKSTAPCATARAGAPRSAKQSTARSADSRTLLVFVGRPAHQARRGADLLGDVQGYHRGLRRQPRDRHRGHAGRRHRHAPQPLHHRKRTSASY